MTHVLKNLFDGALLWGIAGERRPYISPSVTPAKLAKQNIRHSWTVVSKGLAYTARRKLNEAKESRH